MNNEIQHHGIKGQQWGVRRYQNTNGSLTPAGKKRYDSMSNDAKEASELRKKKPNEMSNAELRKLNERQQLEQTHKNLNPSKVKKAIAIASTSAAVLGTMMQLYSNGDKTIKLGKSIVEKFVKK